MTRSYGDKTDIEHANELNRQKDEPKKLPLTTTTTTTKALNAPSAAKGGEAATASESTTGAPEISSETPTTTPTTTPTSTPTSSAPTTPSRSNSRVGPSDSLGPSGTALKGLMELKLELPPSKAVAVEEEGFGMLTADET